MLCCQRAKGRLLGYRERKRERERVCVLTGDSVGSRSEVRTGFVFLWEAKVDIIVVPIEVDKNARWIS